MTGKPATDLRGSFVVLFEHRDAVRPAFLGGDHLLTPEAIREVAWEHGYELEPYSVLAPYEALLVDGGPTLQAEWLEGKASRS